MVTPSCDGNWPPAWVGRAAQGGGRRLARGVRELVRAAPCGLTEGRQARGPEGGCPEPPRSAGLHADSHGLEAPNVLEAVTLSLCYSALVPKEWATRTVEHAMAIAELPHRTASPYDAHTRATSPLRVYAADQQPIRLLAELLGIAPAELVHRAVTEYLRNEQPRIAEVARNAQGAFEAGDFEALARALSAAAETRSARRRERLDRLSRPAEGQ